MSLRVLISYVLHIQLYKQDIAVFVDLASKMLDNAGWSPIIGNGEGRPACEGCHGGIMPI